MAEDTTTVQTTVLTGCNVWSNASQCGLHERIVVFAHTRSGHNVFWAGHTFQNVDRPAETFRTVAKTLPHNRKNVLLDRFQPLKRARPFWKRARPFWKRQSERFRQRVLSCREREIFSLSRAKRSDWRSDRTWFRLTGNAWHSAVCYSRFALCLQRKVFVVCAKWFVTGLRAPVSILRLVFAVLVDTC